ncbi:MAG: PP2C family serine/threonine-protein phosphatase [Myxococcota bacterium]
MNGDRHRNGDDQADLNEAKETLAPGPGQEPWERGRREVPHPTPAGLRFSVYGRSHVGLVREHNEDNFMIADLDSESGPFEREEEIEGAVEERGFALAVCDGMGGAAAGEVASDMAIGALFETLRGDKPAEDRDAFARRLVDSVEEAGSRIYMAAKRDRTRRGMGTTATVAGLIDKVLFVGQVGDSRCYLLRDGQLCLITKDQSLVNQLIEAGQLTEDEAEAFEHSNIILQALGTTERVAVDLTFVELRRGDRLLLCSDGLSGLVHDDAIREEMACVGSLPLLAERLIDLANAAGGHDNVTCIVADFDGDALEPPEPGAVPFYQQYPLPRGGERHSGGPTLPTAVKSMVPRALTAPRPDRVSRPDSSSSFSWPTAATVLLLLGLAAVITIGAGRSRRASAPEELPPPAYADAQTPVEVRVRSSVDRGELYVNGRNYGPLRLDEAVLLRLLPGSYRIEAREVDGTQIGEDVLVAPGTPTEVRLDAPAN